MTELIVLLPDGDCTTYLQYLRRLSATDKRIERLRRQAAMEVDHAEAIKDVLWILLTEDQVAQ